jgi:5-methylcytosine-specific restriction endonuclease McrA
MKQKRPRLMMLKSTLPILQSRVSTLKGTSWRAGKTTDERGYTHRWKQASKRFLAEHPLCQCADCDEGRKRVTAAEVVDHDTPHRGDMRLFWDESNWRALAKACHDRKTQRELQEEANGR